MDVTILVTAVYTIAEEVIMRCKNAKQCCPEAQRIELRTHNLVGTLESAAAAFRNDTGLSKKLVELHEFLGTLPPLMERCERPAKALARARQLMEAPALTKALVDAERTMQNLCDDLGLAMLPSIAERLNVLADELMDGVEARISAAMDKQEAKTREMLERVLAEGLACGVAASTTPPKSGRMLGNVSWDDLVVLEDEVLGEGSFGVVCAGRYFERDVAIKRATHATLPRHVANEFRYET